MDVASAAIRQHQNSTPPLPANTALPFIAGALNIFNIVNRGTPNGVLSSPLFGTTQTLASGPFGLPAPGNRDIFMQALFNF